MAHDASRLAIPCTQHLGLRPSDWNYLGLDLDKLIPFTMMEHRKCLSLLRNPVLRGCPDVRSVSVH